MKKLLLFLFVAGLAGVPAFLVYSTSVFGISEALPLGDFDQLEAWLLKKGFRKTEGELDTSSHEDRGKEYAGARMFHYDDTAKRKDGLPYRVSLVLDGHGKVRAFGAQFYSGSKELGRSRSRSEDIARTMWLAVAGDKPEFKEARRGRGLFTREYLVSTFEKNDVRGRWHKRYMSNLREGSIFNTVMLYTD